MTQILHIFLTILTGFGVLALAALGLVIIFGIMRVINLAHGEFIMVGAFSTVLAYHQGLPLILSIVLGGIVVSVLGALIERLIMRFLYDRLIDTLVATWGVSLILIQLFTIYFGATIQGVSTPLGSFELAGSSWSVYRTLVLPVVAVSMFMLIYVVFKYTEFGIHIRATIQDEEMARNVGIDTSRIYFITFVFGSFLTGIVGGLLAPLGVLSPTMGSGYLIEAFVTVIVGGSNIILGTPIAATLLSGIEGVTSQSFGAFAGRAALLLTTIIIIRIFPRGITGVLD